MPDDTSDRAARAAPAGAAAPAPDYGARLREKQKVKRYYGVFEKQFRRYMDLAGRSKGTISTPKMVPAPV